jgi:hypothetical protein
MKHQTNEMLCWLNDNPMKTEKRYNNDSLKLLLYKLMKRHVD